MSPQPKTPTLLICIPESLVGSQTLLACQDSEFKPAGNAQFAVDIAQVPFDGFLADGQLTGNFAVAVSLFDGGDNFDFPGSESKAARGWLSGACPGSHWFTSNPELTFTNCANALEQQFRR